MLPVLTSIREQLGKLLVLHDESKINVSPIWACDGGTHEIASEAIEGFTDILTGEFEREVCRSADIGRLMVFL